MIGNGILPPAEHYNPADVQTLASGKMKSSKLSQGISLKTSQDAGQKTSSKMPFSPIREEQHVFSFGRSHVLFQGTNILVKSRNHASRRFSLLDNLPLYNTLLSQHIHGSANERPITTVNYILQQLAKAHIHAL